MALPLILVLADKRVYIRGKSHKALVRIILCRIIECSAAYLFEECGITLLVPRIHDSVNFQRIVFAALASIISQNLSVAFSFAIRIRSQNGIREIIGDYQPLRIWLVQKRRDIQAFRIFQRKSSRQPPTCQEILLCRCYLRSTGTSYLPNFFRF